MAMRSIPDGTVAVITSTGSVYHPVWREHDKAPWRGTLIYAPNEKLYREGGNYVFHPGQCDRALTQYQFDIWRLANRANLQLP